MPPVLYRALPAATLTLLFMTSFAHADVTALSYDWNAPFFLLANGGTRDGAVNFVRPLGGSLNGPVSPVAVSAFTALMGGADQYNNVAYSLTFGLTDPNTQQSQVLTVQGQLNGTVTSSGVSLTNSFTDGSGSQTFAFLGHEYTATFGFAAGSGSPWSWGGQITASVEQVSDAAPAATSAPFDAPLPAAAPEPTTFVLAALALPAIGLARWRRRIVG
jgi:hypothetical protein